MRFNPTEKAKGLLRDWHQICQDKESNAQPAWNKARHIFHNAIPKPILNITNLCRSPVWDMGLWSLPALPSFSHQ